MEMIRQCLAAGCVKNSYSLLCARHSVMLSEGTRNRIYQAREALRRRARLHEPELRAKYDAAVHEARLELSHKDSCWGSAPFEGLRLLAAH